MNVSLWDRGTLLLACIAVCSLMLQGVVVAQGPGRGFRGGRGQNGGPPPGRGFGRGQQFGAQGEHGHGADDRFDADHDVFEFLLGNHEKIKRTVKELEDGVETVTESDDEEIASKIKEHVEWMKVRIEKVNPVRMRDPLFAELFQHTDKIVMKYEDTEKGVKVIETSSDPYVAQLIKAHAKVVSKFVENGHAEAMKNHAVPKEEGDHPEHDLATAFPVIKGHGGVVRMPNAAHQPRPGTKLIIDITKGGEPAELNAAIDKVAKYLNIYAGAGAEPAAAEMAVVFHGDATLAVLNPDKYKERFGVKENPNLQLLQDMHHAGVELYVCGQSLVSKEASPDDVVVFVDTAVSALTVIVNMQADGFSYVPLLK